MPKETSPKVVSEEADYERRFTELEETTKANSDTLTKLAAKLLGEEPKPEPKAKPKNEPNPKPAAKSFKGFMVDIGLFKPENSEG